MASYFEEEHFFLGENSNHMVTVPPFMGKLKVHIRQLYVNEKEEKKPGKNEIVLELTYPQVQDSIARYELKDTEILSSPFELDLPVLDLDTVFLPSPPLQEPISVIQNEERLDSQPKCPSSPPLFLPNVQTPLIEPSLENELNDLDLYSYVPGERRKLANEPSEKSNKKPKIENSKTSGIFVGYAKLPPEMKEEQKKERRERSSRKRNVSTRLLLLNQ